MSKVWEFCKKEMVFTISLILALLSFLLTPPSAATLTSIDFPTLLMLFALMTVVAGLKSQGVFTALARVLGRRVTSLRLLALLLVNVCFFLPMVITNDVALLTFVPFTLLLLHGCAPMELIWVVTLETMAANLGSMATPIGNPQNLYLYVSQGLSFGDFLSTLAPFVAVSWAVLSLGTLLLPRRTLPPFTAQDAGDARDGRLYLWCAMLPVCLLCVFKVLPQWAAAACVLAAALAADRQLLRRVDWVLLATFVCFFVFVGNVKAVPQVSAWLSGLLTGREVLVGALCSQVISNVPATLLLAPFTTQSCALMLGVDLGGLGTLVASLASLISFKLYSRAEGAQTGRFLAVFTGSNFVLLALLLGLAALLGWL